MKEKYTCYSCGKEIRNFDDIIRINRYIGFLADPYATISDGGHYVLCADCDNAIMQFCQCQKKKQKKDCK